MPSEDPLSFAQSLAKLQARQAANPKAYRLGATPAEIARANADLPIPIPPAWQEMLMISAEFHGLGWEIWDPSSIHATDDAAFKELFDDEFVAGLGALKLVVASDFTGDIMLLDTERLTPEGDCPVLWASHEGESQNDRWETVGAFLQWILTDDKRQP